tara:strand:+ start:5979 stop:7226 length:1248 start_codon:yes stop_codon:yes gene_type:complete
MDNQIKTGIALAAAFGLPALAIAGPEAAPIEPPASNSGDWCSWLQSKPGTLYKNKENPFIQEFQIEGRLQYQMGYVDGENIAGGDFNEGYDEYRRARLGVKAKFLQYFGLKYQVNIVNDNRNGGGGELDWGYDSIDEAYVSFNLAKAIGNTGFDDLSLKYGRQKFVFGTEAHTSSTKLLTVERSALSNKVYGSSRPTGLTLEGARGPISFAASIYSSTTDAANNDEFNGWQDSYSLLFNLGYEVNDQLLVRGDFTYNAAAGSATEDSVMSYEWAVDFGAEYDAGPWGVNADVIYGDNGDAVLAGGATRSGNFYGLQVTPWMWLVDEKLQLVGQYQYQGSEGANGVRINSRYGRARGIGGINGGRGDSHHSFYTGLNYYLCGHNAKIQGGIEYQTMDTPAGDFDTLTYVLAFRTYF